MCSIFCNIPALPRLSAAHLSERTSRPSRGWRVRCRPGPPLSSSTGASYIGVQLGNNDGTTWKPEAHLAEGTIAAHITECSGSNSRPSHRGPQKDLGSGSASHSRSHRLMQQGSVRCKQGRQQSLTQKSLTPRSFVASKPPWGPAKWMPSCIYLSGVVPTSRPPHLTQTAVPPPSFPLIPRPCEYGRRFGDKTDGKIGKRVEQQNQSVD